jgi:hypothetical protein
MKAGLFVCCGFAASHLIGETLSFAAVSNLANIEKFQFSMGGPCVTFFKV